MLTRILFFIGLVLLILAFAGLVLTSTRSFPRQILTASVHGEDLVRAQASSTSSEMYTVESGDTLMGISKKLFNGDPQYWDEIAELNGIGPPYTIHPGQELKVPDARPMPTNTPTLPIYTPVPPTDTLVPPSTEIPTTESPTCTPMPIAMIEAEWPKRMEIKRPGSIRVSLVRTTGQAFTPTIEIAGHTAIVASPIPVGGTPEAPIARAFGEYEAFAIANLYGSAFDINPPETGDKKSLDQPRMNWEWQWIITPRESDWQIVLVNIKVQWEPVGSDGQPISPREIWSERLEIYVDEPGVTIGQISVMSLFNGLIGSALAVPWLYERMKERREKLQKDEESKPKILLP